MTEDEWLTCTDPRVMLHFLWSRESDRKLRLFAVACCGCSDRLLQNEDHRQALEVATRFADGQVTDEVLAKDHRRAHEIACHLYGGKTEREIHRWAEATAVANAVGVVTADHPMAGYAADAVWMIQRAAQRDPNERLVRLLRDVCGNPFRRWPEWKTIRSWAGDGRFSVRDLSCVTPTTKELAMRIYAERAFNLLPLLADTLEEAGCTDEEILTHCRQQVEHVRGCWVVDLILRNR